MGCMTAIILIAALIPVGLIVAREYTKIAIARLRWAAVKFVAVGALALVVAPMVLSKVHDVQAQAATQLTVPARPPTTSTAPPAHPRVTVPVTYSQLPYSPKRP